MRCHNHTDTDGKKYFIPGCMGSAVYGEYRCTCYKFIGPKKKEEDLEAECQYLKSLLHAVGLENNKLKKEISDIRRKGLPAFFD